MCARDKGGRVGAEVDARRRKDIIPSEGEEGEESQDRRTSGPDWPDHAVNFQCYRASAFARLHVLTFFSTEALHRIMPSVA